MGAIREETIEPVSKTSPKRVFTPGEANRAIVLVKRIVADIVTEYARLLDIQEALEAAEASGALDRYEETRLALIRSAGRLRRCLAELDDVGVELKDWSLGVVDFPSVAAGREVCLSWQHGQERIETWHEVDSSFAHGRPIETLPASGRYVGHHSAASKPRPTGGKADNRLPNR